MNPLYEKICREDAIVQHGLQVNASPEDIIVALASEKQKLIKRIMELEAIAPRKLQVDGKLFVWHCPDDLIPITDCQPGT